MPRFAEASFDAIVTDPPYGINLMHDAGVRWDNGWGDAQRRWNPRCTDCGGRPRGSNRCSCLLPRWEDIPGINAQQYGAWCSTWAGGALRVLKPGGHALVFGSPKTVHRLTVALEDAGFEIRDQIFWLYASGVPKTPRLPAGWDGWATNLKPSAEVIVVARRPLIGTIGDNLAAHRVGALNVTGCRNGDEPLRAVTRNAELGDQRWRSLTRTQVTPQRNGRWPSNVVFSHSENCDQAECPTDCPGKGLPKQGSYFPSFRFETKPNAAERSAGLEVRNSHATVKPVELMRWLIRLVVPRDGRLLDPFAGSGTTLVASILEGGRAVGVERDHAMVRTIDGRCRWAERQHP